jgi:hypothetical protein
LTIAALEGLAFQIRHHKVIKRRRWFHRVVWK